MSVITFCRTLFTHRRLSGRDVYQPLGPAEGLKGVRGRSGPMGNTDDRQRYLIVVTDKKQRRDVSRVSGKQLHGRNILSGLSLRGCTHLSGLLLN